MTAKKTDPLLAQNPPSPQSGGSYRINPETGELERNVESAPPPGSAIDGAGAQEGESPAASPQPTTTED